jgi:hypothetical protein
MAHLGDEPEVLAVAGIPSAEERKRRELVLARLLLLSLEMLLNEGHTELAVKIDTAKDMIREFKHVYPEAMNRLTAAVQPNKPIRQPKLSTGWKYGSNLASTEAWLVRL